SNSIDFGNYDYSGNPNLMSKLKSSDFNVGYHGSLTSDNEKLHFTSDGTGSIIMFTRINTPQLASGKTYTLSAKVRFDEGTTGAIDKLRLVYRTSPGEKILLEANSTNITTDDVGKEITIKGTANVNYQITNLDRFYMSISFVDRDKINGGFKLYDIKIEEGSTATPYQPNL
ncbi:BppU family phage baseplate upper protein, partial [Enterococcus faecium]